MRKTFTRLLTLVLLLTSLSLSAQKVDQRLTRLVEQVSQRRVMGLTPLDAKAVNKTIAVSFNADGTIAAFSGIAMLKDGAECPTARLEQMGVKVRYQIGDMVALSIPTDKLQLLEEVEEIRYVKADEVTRPMNDLGRQATKADQVYDAVKATAAKLPQAYTGKGVILGVIDQGIDFNHAAFRNADGSTRVGQAIIMKNSLGEYTSYTTEDIPGLLTDDFTTSHGSHTAATAGGTGLSNGMQGVAPEVELYLCGLNEYPSVSYVAGCIQEIFKYADKVNKPAVVSISMGNVNNIHDGSDAVAYTVGKLTENGTKPGRAVVMSTSNAAANWQSIAKSSSVKTVLGSASIVTDKAPATYTGLYSFYASDYQDFTISLKVVDITTGTVGDLGSHVVNQTTGEVMSNTLLVKYDNIATSIEGKTAVVYYLNCQATAVKLDDPKYRLAIVATPKDGQTLKLISNGENYAEPCFDAPTAGGYDFAVNGWTKGTSEVTISSHICNDGVISVGSYITRTGWKTWQGDSKSYLKSSLTGKMQQLGEISDFSGWGTDDNGKTHPTVIAPGQGIISAANMFDATTFTADTDNEMIVPNKETTNAQDFLIGNVERHGRSNWYLLDQGTSMSTPLAAGIVALWMQAKPTLTVSEIKDIMKATCVNDTWTTNTDNIPSGNKMQAGYGKIDALAGLRKILNTDGIETIGVGGHREATPATMYRVDAPVYNLKGQRVDKDQKGLVIYKGRIYLNK